jgi:predicted DNA-binding transcriptional regulator YafY
MTHTTGITPGRWEKRRTFAGKIADTRRVERTLRLVAFLSEPRTNRQIADHLRIDLRSTYRYIDLLVWLGFAVVTDRAGKRHRHRITNAAEFFNLDKTED